MVFYFFGTKQQLFGAAVDPTPLVMLTRSAPTDAQSEALLREFIDREMLGTPDAALRAAMVNAQILGFTVARYIMRPEPIAPCSVGELVDRFGPLVQYCLTGPTATPGSASVTTGSGTTPTAG